MLDSITHHRQLGSLRTTLQRENSPVSRHEPHPARKLHVAVAAVRRNSWVSPRFEAGPHRMHLGCVWEAI